MGIVEEPNAGMLEHQESQADDRVVKLLALAVVALVSNAAVSSSGGPSREPDVAPVPAGPSGDQFDAVARRAATHTLTTLA
ncbi:MAG: hypothetical protein ACI867_001866 [Glaciecola sp.]|jgi:hypothetical protein